MRRLRPSQSLVLLLSLTAALSSRAQDDAPDAPADVAPPSAPAPAPAPASDPASDPALPAAEAPAPAVSPAPAPAPAPAEATAPAEAVDPAARPLAADLSAGRLQRPDAPWRLRAAAELGSLWVLSHTLQFGQAGTRLDYVTQGGQDSLFPFARLSAEAELNRRHNFVFLFQPLTLTSNVVMRQPLRVYDTTFSEGEYVRMKYGFDFVRFSYFYDFLEDPRHELGFGASLQIRNAIIDFASGDGEKFSGNRNVGPVPILKARWRSTFDDGAFVGAEIDAFYANIPIANGDLESEVEGAVCDASLRAGIPFTGFSRAFVNLRYIGGGSSGTEIGEDAEGDGYADNWLHSVALSLGVEID